MHLSAWQKRCSGVSSLVILLTCHGPGWCGAEPAATPRTEVLAGGFVAVESDAGTPPPERPTRLRGRASYRFLAPPGAEVSFTVRGIQVGRYEDDVRVTVTDAAGTELMRDTVPHSGRKALTLTAPRHEGLITVECRAGRNAVELAATGGRLLYPRGDAPLKIIAHANPLYFYVEESAQEFLLELAGQGDLETAQASVRDPEGREVALVSTVDGPVQHRTVPVPRGMGGRVWSVQIAKASRGVFEDCTLKLLGDLGPYLAERPEDLVAPALRLEAPALVRPEERSVFRARVFTAAPLRGSLAGMRLAVLKADGESVGELRVLQDGAVETEWIRDLPAGTYRLRLTASVGTKELLETRPLHVTARPPNLDYAKTTRVNGKPFFARGLYHVRPEDYELVKAQGFNIVQATPPHIPRLERVGLKAAVALYPGMGIRIDYYRESLRKYGKSPAVACWMTMDEPAHHGISLGLMAEGYATIRELVDHPAYTCICRPDAYTDYGRCTDIIAIDVYPVGKRPLTAISETLDIAKRNAPGRTIWFIGQVWSWPDTRLVTPREHRCMTYLALTHADVRGLFWYSFRDPGWYLPESNQPVWEMCARVNRELEKLEPVLLQRNLWERVARDGKGEVHLAAKRHEGVLYVIATNPTEHPADLDFNLRPEKAALTGREVFEGREVTLQDGRLKESFESLDTRVYAWPIRKGKP